MDKTEAQKQIEDAVLAIGRNGGKDFVIAVSQVSDNGDYGNQGIAMAGTREEMIKGLTHAMQADRELRNILIGAVNNYALNKLFNRGKDDCDCPACQARRKKAQQN